MQILGKKMSIGSVFKFNHKIIIVRKREYCVDSYIEILIFNTLEF